MDVIGFVDRHSGPECSAWHDGLVGVLDVLSHVAFQLPCQFGLLVRFSHGAIPVDFVLRHNAKAKLHRAGGATE